MTSKWTSLARPDGSVLYASLHPAPRPETPLPGWVFKLGPSVSHVRGDEGYFRDEHAMLVTYAGRTVLVPPDKPVRMDGADHGPGYEVRASGYTLTGVLPTWMRAMGPQGFGLTVREVATTATR